MTHVGQSGLLAAALGRIFISLVIKEVDVGVSLSVNDIGNYNGADRGSEGGLEALEHAVEARVLVAQTVDKEYLGQTRLVSRLDSLFGADAHAVLAGYNDQGDVRGAHTLGDAARKVEQTGSVDEVDLGVLPLYRGNSGHDRSLALDLLAVKIECGVAVGDLSEAVARLSEIKNGFRDRGLAAAAVTRKGDV